MAFLIFIAILLFVFLCKFVYKSFTFKYKKYREVYFTTEIPKNLQIDESFFSSSKDLMFNLEFQEKGKYYSENELEKKNYFELYGNKKEGVLVFLSQTLIKKIDESDEDEIKEITYKELAVRLETCLKNGIQIISTSSNLPNNLLKIPNVFEFKYPNLSLKEMLEEHKKNIDRYSQNTEIDYDYINKDPNEINREETDGFLEYQLLNGTIKYNDEKDDYFLTLKGFFVKVKNFFKDLFSQKTSYKKIYKTEIIENKTIKKRQDSRISIIVVIIIGLLMSFFGVTNLIKGSQTKKWLETTGEILYFNIIDNFEDIDVDVKYKYVVDEKIYTGEKISYGDSSTKNDLEVNRLSKKFSNVGEIVPVYYNPKKPSQAVLERGNDFFSSWPLIMGLFIFFFVITDLFKKQDNIWKWVLCDKVTELFDIYMIW